MLIDNKKLKMIVFWVCFYIILMKRGEVLIDAPQLRDDT